MTPHFVAMLPLHCDFLATLDGDQGIPTES
jgi:hypothetical protein